MIHISANRLAEFTVARTPEARQRIVRSLKQQASKTNKGYAPYYSAFTGPARRFLANGAADTADITRAITRIAARPKGTWNDIDCRITGEAFQGLIDMAGALQRLNIQFNLRPNGQKCILQFPDVAVNVTPDLMVAGHRNGIPLLGAARFYLAKEYAYQLRPQQAELIAIMEYQWLIRNNSTRRTADADLCLVLECQQGRITRAPANHQRQLDQLQLASAQLVRLWTGTEEAA